MQIIQKAYGSKSWKFTKNKGSVIFLNLFIFTLLHVLIFHYLFHHFSLSKKFHGSTQFLPIFKEATTTSTSTAIYILKISESVAVKMLSLPKLPEQMHASLNLFSHCLHIFSTLLWANTCIIMNLWAAKWPVFWQHSALCTYSLNKILFAMIFCKRYLCDLVKTCETHKRRTRHIYTIG